MSEFEQEHPRNRERRFQEEQRPRAPLNTSALNDEFVNLLESAARLQQIVPDAVMVGGSAAAIYAQHRFSTGHDHVLEFLESRYDMVLEALGASDSWVASFRSAPPETILGMEAGFQAGIRQLRRKEPLETTTITLPSGAELVIPTEEEILRIKSYLIVNRNQARDYLDTAALSTHLGMERARSVVADIDTYYGELSNTDGAVSTVLADRLYQCRPKDHKAIATLPRFKGLDPEWADWNHVTDVCHELVKGVLK